MSSHTSPSAAAAARAAASPRVHGVHSGCSRRSSPGQRALGAVVVVAAAVALAGCVPAAGATSPPASTTGSASSASSYPSASATSAAPNDAQVAQALFTSVGVADWATGEAGGHSLDAAATLSAPPGFPTALVPQVGTQMRTWMNAAALDPAVITAADAPSALTALAPAMPAGWRDGLTESWHRNGPLSADLMASGVRLLGPPRVHATAASATVDDSAHSGPGATAARFMLVATLVYPVAYADPAVSGAAPVDTVIAVQREMTFDSDVAGTEVPDGSYHALSTALAYTDATCTARHLGRLAPDTSWSTQDLSTDIAALAAGETTLTGQITKTHPATLDLPRPAAACS